MMFPQALMALGALLAFVPATQGSTSPCVYQGYKCGYTMVTEFGYNNTELTFAVNKTNVVPPLNTIQLLNVLYRCVDTRGDIAANSFCIAGCISVGDFTVSDECAM
ncbi:uncharacterized protein K444DRAFT_641069 [Hyaloscypha bicolor E]|uniref:Uncharacterized protein n=1 Tax=Hyaloscypha bicolor E TaxID=1095630 RepID=A0A2J6TM99_9HELO|nr:uncharacterized protein K444DRAFT_641069 [Hyaloscypha bicolor E]PMD64139.1 hypothetical protein K444DRAFT_641069 [Hyaloscypha bicolor E]